LREAAGAAYAAALRALAKAAAERGDADAAVRAQLRLLERDRWDAEAHVALIGLLESSGRHGEAMRRYRAYEAAMAEIGVAIAPFPGHLKATRTALEHGSRVP
jgi:DNA-binding SARP family transcriptional activator